MNYFFFLTKCGEHLVFVLGSLWMYLSCHMSCERTPTCVNKVHPALKWLRHLIKSHKTLTLHRWHCMHDFRALTPTLTFALLDKALSQLLCISSYGIQ